MSIEERTAYREVDDSGEDWGDVTSPQQVDVYEMLEAHLTDLLVSGSA